MSEKRVLVLPDDVQLQEATPFLRLPHPGTGEPALFLPRGAEGLLELQVISPPPSRERSWFVGTDTVEADGKLYTLTVFDVAFLLASLLSKIPHFLPLSSLVDSASEAAESRSLKSTSISDDSNTNNTIPSDTAINKTQLDQDVSELFQLPDANEAIEKICDIQMVDDLSTYRFSRAKFLQYLTRKVDVICNSGHMDKISTFQRRLAKDGLVGDQENVNADVLKEAKQKMAIDVVANYLTDEHMHIFRANYNFEQLHKYLSERTKDLMAGEYHPGLTPNENGCQATKQSNNKVKTNKGGKGVEALKKVNTTGMKKMTSYFTKK